ncbi:hypothetical protein [Nocardioides lianchengensis]|uniref:Uncharacterized protein n=1 Tax=Nocardioides lianchengensis TaxID=1045774 RepID=A0A1G6YG49_9ACTN|nr:hypothetical protein [Nocardioides lianchengensis]NYG09658.1 hypothetical protein [Nocardioides lianchengensis]SDD89340.1 hypothetical protein SAMN05421872_11235 [Nocardioides lianchengensis]
MNDALRRRLTAPIATAIVVAVGLLTAASRDDAPGPRAVPEPPGIEDVCAGYRSFQEALAALATKPSAEAVGTLQQRASAAAGTMTLATVEPAVRAGMGYLDELVQTLGPTSTVDDITTADAGSTVADSANVQALTDFAATSCTS